MKTVTRVFLKGLAASLPPTATIYFFWWLGKTAGEIMRPVFDRVGIDNVAYKPWMGIALALALIFAVGLLMNAYIVRILYGAGESVIEKIPLVKTLYGSLRDLMGFFASGDNKPRMDQVVMVTIGDSKAKLLGLVTRDDFGDLPAGIGDDGTVAVYLPMSYQLGGFTTMIPRDSIEPVDMSVEAAMRFAVTAGMKSKDAVT